MNEFSFELIDLVKEKKEIDYANDIRSGFSASEKYSPTKYVYDEEGSLLFDKLTQQPDYYLTYAETEILNKFSHDIISHIDRDAVLVELGSGNSVKTRILLNALLSQQQTPTFVPIDISREFLSNSISVLKKDYPDLKILGVAADYHDGLEILAEHINHPKLIIWLGSDVGHLPYDQAFHMLKDKIVTLMNSCDRLLLGIDMKKDSSIINEGYGCCGHNSSYIASKALAQNHLLRINRELQANLEVDQFTYDCHYNKDAGRMELNLRSLCKQTAFIGALSMQVNFEKNELIHLHHSYKYDNDDIQRLSDETNLHWDRQWSDENNFYTLNLFSKNN